MMLLVMKMVGNLLNLRRHDVVRMIVDMDLPPGDQSGLDSMPVPPEEPVAEPSDLDLD